MVFWSFLGYGEYFGHFLDFGDILVIFKFWGYFGHFMISGSFGHFLGFEGILVIL